MIYSKKKPLVLIVLVLVLVISMTLWHHLKKTTSLKTTAIPVKTSIVEIANTPITVTANGNLTAHQQTDISPKIGGYIKQLFFHEGDFIKSGHVLITLDDSKQKEDYASAKADAELSYSNYKRNLFLKKQAYISLQDLDKLKAQYQKDQATLLGIQTTLNDLVLKAPFDGFLGAKNISVGDYVAPGQKLVNIVDIGTLEAIYSLPSRYSPKIKLGQSVKITADFLPQEKWQGKVSYVAPNVDAASQTIEVHVTLDNKQGYLKPGQYVNISQTLGTHQNMILVPENAVSPSMNDTTVFQVKNNHIISTSVTLGQHVNGKVEITQGLKPHDRIVTTGQNQVKAGDLVTVVNQPSTLAANR